VSPYLRPARGGSLVLRGCVLSVLRIPFIFEGACYATNNGVDRLSLLPRKTQV